MKQSNTLNLENFWIPFTANKAFKEEPRLLVEAEGMFYKSEDDKQYGVSLGCYKEISNLVIKPYQLSKKRKTF